MATFSGEIHLESTFTGARGVEKGITMKLRFFGAAILTTLLLAEVSGAQEWAQKMFKIKSHDFGVVARNSKTEYAFEIENPYAVDVHITAVRASCGCTTPAITKQQLTTYEKGSILATYNTGAFLGKRGATLTVTFDQPRYAEVQLKVTGFIRSDVQIQPGGISFGAVDQGHSANSGELPKYSGRAITLISHGIVCPVSSVRFPTS